MIVRSANNFLLKGKLNELFYISGSIANINLDKKIFEKIKSQDQDCPALYSYIYENVMHEIHIVDDIIISISTSFYNNFKMKIFIEGENGSMFKLKVKSSILDFANFLNVNNYFWEMDKANSRDKTLGIKINSLTTLMYSFEKGEEGVVQISSFDRLLYNKISEKYHT